MPIFRQEQARVSDGALGESIQLCKINQQGLLEIRQAAHTLRLHCGTHFHLHKQTLGSAPDARRAVEICQVEIRRQMDLVNFYIKIPVVSDGLVRDKADVQPERGKRISQNDLIISQIIFLNFVIL